MTEQSNKPWWTDLPDDEVVENAWERDMNLSGIEAFEMARYDSKGKLRPASETVTGQKQMRNYLTAAEAAIKAVQTNLIPINRVPRSLKATLMVVPSDTLALLTMRILFDRTMSSPDPNDGANLQTTCVFLASSVEGELNFRNWVKKSKEAAKIYASENDRQKVGPSIAERLIEEHGLSGRSLSRWKHTFEELSEYQWSTEEKHYCGEALINAVVESMPDVFDIGIFLRKGKASKTVRMLPDAYKKFCEMEGNIASMQVTKKPMLRRPNPWKEVTE